MVGEKNKVSKIKSGINFFRHWAPPRLNYHVIMSDRRWLVHVLDWLGHALYLNIAICYQFFFTNKKKWFPLTTNLLWWKLILARAIKIVYFMWTTNTEKKSKGIIHAAEQQRYDLFILVAGSSESINLTFHFLSKLSLCLGSYTVAKWCWPIIYLWCVICPHWVSKLFLAGRLLETETNNERLCDYFQVGIIAVMLGLCGYDMILKFIKVKAIIWLQRDSRIRCISFFMKLSKINGTVKYLRVKIGKHEQWHKFPESITLIALLILIRR